MSSGQTDLAGARIGPMRLAESPEQHFTEGEPDLEPPEELAISELDDVTVLEEELDNEDVLEQDVEEGVLEETLEDLVHHDDADDDDGDEIELPVGLVVGGARADGDDDDELDGGDEEEEGLDLVLEHRLAPVDERSIDDGDVDSVAGQAVDPAAPDGKTAPGQADDVRPCGPDEFTCRSCFLVHSRTLLADPRALICRDCSG